MMQRAVKHRLKRHEWRALLVCILVSATIWLLRALNAPASGHIVVGVRYSGDSDCAVAHCVPPSITVEIESSGFEVLGQVLLPRRRFIQIDPELLAKKGEQRYVTTESLSKELRALVGNQYTVQSLSTDSVLIVCSTP